MGVPIEGLFSDKPKEVYKETASEADKKKLKKSYLDVVDKPPDNSEGGTVFDLSVLEGIAYSQFKRDLFKICAEMDSKHTRTIMIPLEFWTDKYGPRVYLIPNNPVYNLLELITKDTDQMHKNLSGISFLFYRGKKWFIVTADKYAASNNPILYSNIETLCYDNVHTAALTGKKQRPITTQELDKMKDADLEDKKSDLVQAVADKAEYSDSEEDFLATVDEDDTRIVDLINDISDDSYGKPKMSKARASRMTRVDQDFKSARTNSGKTLQEVIDNPDGAKELPVEELKVASINQEDWSHMQFTTFNKSYDIDEDIRLILESFSDKEYPLVVRSIEVEDTSTSEDYIMTYHVGMEDMSGKQFTIVFDIPKFVNNRFLRLRGNDKYISGQLFNLPCTKTSDDTVQVVSNYRKIMISRYGATGKSYPASDRLIKALNKYQGNKIKISRGDNHRTCSKYELPVDYIDLTYQFNYIKADHYTFYLDQDYYYKNFAVDTSDGKIPIAVVHPIQGEDYLFYVSPAMMAYPGQPITNYIAEILCGIDKDFEEIYKNQKAATKHTYSRASIMAAQIPMVVVICNSIPFTEMLKRANIEYEFSEKRVRYDPDSQGCIPFSDGYLVYQLTYPASMLLNGLMDCDTENYRFVDMNKKSTWLDFLDNFGGRIKADGLDNFKEVFMDPITQEVCRDCGVPDDYIDILIYANSLLADNKYIKHTDMASNRYRTNEIVAGHLYQVLAGEYIKYRAQAKKGRKKSNFSVKRSAVIDAIFENPVTSDLSSMSPLLEQEANNSATFKGLSGLNSDRAYSLEKRTYDDSMTGKLALSTGFASNVGINRQTTIDMDIAGKRGYIKSTPNDTKSVTKRLSMTEAVTPFGSTRDDPFRSAMTYIQTAKHSMPTNKAMPLLITNGADEALAYTVSENYVIRAKEDGQVVELVPDDHMIVTYKSGEGQYISLKDEVRKNSDGGFYLTIKMSTDIKKEGTKFKENDILAYDIKSFSNRNGETDNLAYDVGVLAYVAIMATDEGFEDSTAISHWLSEALGSEVVSQEEVELGRGANVYSIVKPGQPIQEGDPLIIFQNAFEEEDANILLKNITDEDFVSDLGRIRKKAKYTGVVEAVKVYRTCEIEELSSSLQKIVKEYESSINKKKALYKKYKVPNANTLEPTEAMPAAGKLKNTDGVRIEFYIKYFDNMSVGEAA